MTPTPLFPIFPILPILPIATIQSVLEFFIQGGFFMLLLVLCSLVAVTVMFWRGLALRRAMVMPPVLEDAISSLQPRDLPERATQLERLTRGDSSALGRIVHITLEHLNWTKSENLEAVQTRARHEIVRLENGLMILEVIVGIGPLLGLLGTVSGLVSVFGHLGSASASMDPRGIASGIAEALNTTIAGLAIAVPSLIAHSYFSKKIETMAAEMETLTGALLTKCYSHRERTTRRAIPTTATDDQE